MTALLESEGLTKRFGGIAALDCCSISVAEGTITALIGPNGSGKTTLFNLVTGYLPADSGSIAFAGRSVRRPHPASLYRMGLCRTFQQARVFSNLTVIENMAAAILQPWSSLLRSRVRPSDRSRALEVLDDFGLTRLADAPAGTLSFGQRKLLEFATVLMGRPRIILLDEPTSGVNPVMIEIMERHIRELHAAGADLPDRRARHACGDAAVRPGDRARPRREDRRGSARRRAERPHRPRRLPGDVSRC